MNKYEDIGRFVEQMARLREFVKGYSPEGAASFLIRSDGSMVLRWDAAEERVVNPGQLAEMIAEFEKKGGDSA